MRIFVSPVESSRFGLILARADDFAAADWDELADFCARNNVAMAVVRTPAEDAKAAEALASRGASLMDTLAQYRIAIGADPPWPACEGFALRMADAGDAGAIRAVVLAVFAGYSNHYAADPRLDAAAATEGYAEWAASHLGAGDSKGVCVAVIGGAVVAISALTCDRGAGAVSLIGVAPAARRHGIGAAMLQHHLAWCRERGAKWFSISTQSDNLASQRLLARLSFEPRGALNTFHKWFC
jgi:GNAT superfamily N-acetyltransferase